MVYKTRYETKDGKTSRVSDEAPVANPETTTKTAAPRDEKSAPTPRKGVNDE